MGNGEYLCFLTLTRKSGFWMNYTTYYYYFVQMEKCASRKDKPISNKYHRCDTCDEKFSAARLINLY